MMRVLAIDSSSAITGFAILEQLPENQAQLVSCGEIKLKNTNEPFLHLFNELNKIIQEHKPNIGVIESAFFGLNQKTFGVLENYRGIATLALLVNGIDSAHIFEMMPSQVRKRLFGNGKMQKQECCEKISEYFKQGLATKGFDQSDAICLGLSHLGVKLF